MAKAKLWKISTKVEGYVDLFFDLIDMYELKMGDVFIVKNNKKTSRVIFEFDQDGGVEQYDDSKATQIIRTLLTLNIIWTEDFKYAKNNQFLTNQVTYKINSNRKNWRENFIEEVGTFGFLDELNEEGEDLIEFKYSNHKDSLYSIMKSFEVYDNDEINEYENKEDRECIGQWVIRELFDDFDNELREISAKLIHPITSTIKRVSNLETIEWVDFKINNLSQIKEKQLESTLMNLSDVLSSTKNILIPIMQRKYVWDIDLVGKLVDDIFSIDETKPFHYIGSIVYKEKGFSIRILDGQQRLTTMFLILVALSEFYISEDAQEYSIKVPKFLNEIFPKGGMASNKALFKRFQHVHGNSDYLEFYSILSEGVKFKKLEKGNMYKNFDYAIQKIKNEFILADDDKKQDVLDKIFQNLIERVAFTFNKNQIESEYVIFEKLNTLSEPLGQIDLLKNYLLPFCNEDELDANESAVQNEFNIKIFEKFTKNKKTSEASVKRFMNYFIQLNESKYITNDNERALKPFNKMSLIIEKMFKLKVNSLSLYEFTRLLDNIGSEIDSFLWITDREFYTDPKNKYHTFADILSSFEKRYVYAPLIKYIFDMESVLELDSGKVNDREVINKVRSILFEIERYELFLQVVLYRGQSIAGIIEKVIRKVNEYYTLSDKHLTPSLMRGIFKNPEIMSSALVLPELDTFTKKVKEEPLADKVSILILNRLKFYHNNQNKIELSSVFNYKFLVKPSREHIISQTISDPKLRQVIFNQSSIISNSKEYSDDDFNRLHKQSIDMIGNILMVESSDNSGFKNKSPMDKLKQYSEKEYLEKDPVFVGKESNQKNNPLSLKNTLHLEQLDFDKVHERSKSIAELLGEIYS